MVITAPRLHDVKDPLKRLVLVESFLQQWVRPAHEMLVKGGANDEEIVQALHVITARAMEEHLCCPDHANETIDLANTYMADTYHHDEKAEFTQ